MGVLREQGKDSSLVKIVPQLPGCDRLCPVRREVGKPPPRLSLTVTPSRSKGKTSKLVAWESACRIVRRSFALSVSNLVGLVGCPAASLAAFSLSRASCLSLPPVFPFCYPFLAAVQEVDLVKSLPVAHLHDFTLEIFHSGIGAAVLAALPCVGWSVHVGQKRDFINPQGVDDDMHMDIAAVVMPVRVGAD